MDVERGGKKVYQIKIGSIKEKTFKAPKRSSCEKCRALMNRFKACIQKIQHFKKVHDS